MKKLLLSITAVASFALSVKAQAPDYNFENWAATPSPSTSENPVGWSSFNVVTFLGMNQTVFRETANPYGGTGISAKIVTDVLPAGISIKNPYEPGKNFDTVGMLAIGKTVFSATAPVKYGYDTAVGFPRPSTLSFQCMYTPIGNDSAFVVAFLTKWNGTKRDTIAGGKFSTGASTSSYSLNSITMTYNPAFMYVVPDSQQIFISSSVFAHNGAQKGSAFWIDAVTWSGHVPVGTNEIAPVKEAVSVYPNPAKDVITFNSTVNASSVEMTDITGRLVNTYKMIDNKVVVQTAHLAAGTYLYNILNDKKEVVSRGKFEVTK